MSGVKVAISLDSNRIRAIINVAKAIGLPNFERKDVLIKPNFNTSDPAPASTHIDTLKAIVGIVKKDSPSSVVVADRSGPMSTRQVFFEKGIFDYGKEEGFSCLIFDEMPDENYRKIQPPSSHWKDGFLFARPVLQADRVVCLCCLKTHQYGGHFSMSLKLTTGMVHRMNMDELHTSAYQREMIAEMNYAYEPDLIIMDGVESFYTGGPMRGAIWRANLTLASKDRVAIDAVGVAALKMHGTTPEIERRPVFMQDQIKRAAELGLGVREAKEIELVPLNKEAEEITSLIEDQLMA
ncbi:MAG: DUF362 domain-containing protein [Methanomassiliicoccales archaeon]